jgi:hypothetical protein
MQVLKVLSIDMDLAEIGYCGLVPQLATAHTALVRLFMQGLARAI